MATARTFFASVMRGAHLPHASTRTAATCSRKIPRSTAVHITPQPRISRFFHTGPPHSQRYQRFGIPNSSAGPGASRRQFVGNLFTRWAARPTFYYELGGLGAGAGGVYVYNVEAVPITGRRRFNCISPAYEEQLGQQQLEQILQQYGQAVLPEYDPRVRKVRRVLDRLIPVAGVSEGKEWSLHVIESEEKNAFVIPGGHVFVFTGILPVCGNGDDGLATVLGHEIAHNVAHHVAEKMSRMLPLTVITVGLDAFGILPAQVGQTVVQFLLEMPASRKEESEADYIGLMLLARACFDPSQAVSFWERMGEVEQKMGAPPAWMSTHPSSHDRQERLVELQGRAREEAEKSQCGNLGGYVNDFKQSFDRFG